MCSDQDAFVAREPASDRYQHIRFLSSGDYALPVRSRSLGVKPQRLSGNGNRHPTSCAMVRAGAQQPGASPPFRIACHRADDSRTPHPSGDPLDPEALRFVRWVLDYAGVDPDCYRSEPLARRLQACLRLLRARSIAEAWERLQQEPERMRLAVSTLLIGVTQFFREPAVFSYLDEVVFPKLSSRGAGLRVWSAGCADGAELYSVAMLLAERGLLEGSTLLGTDCRADAVRQAEWGWFEPARLESLDERLRHAYFVPHQRGWQVCHALREATRWRQQDAFAGAPAGEQPWDLILCRNLAIYLEPSAAARLWSVLAGSLRAGGILVVGKAERPEQPSLVRLAPCVLEKRG